MTNQSDLPKQKLSSLNPSGLLMLNQSKVNPQPRALRALDKPPQNVLEPSCDNKSKYAQTSCDNPEVVVAVTCDKPEVMPAATFDKPEVGAAAVPGVSPSGINPSDIYSCWTCGFKGTTR